MKSFNAFLDETKNVHMTHVEDQVIYGGVNGTRQAINALRNMRDMLAGYQEGTVSVKWDGAPAIWAGIDPADGKFFVAKKGILKKVPEVYKSEEDIAADSKLSGDLADKFRVALKYLPELGIKGIVQGDFLFTRKELKIKKIHGEKFVSFHPNTLVYAIPAADAKPLLNSKVGIVWHTAYTTNGENLKGLRQSFGVNVAGFKKTKNVWSQDAMLRDESSVVLSAKDTKLITERLSLAGKLFTQISGNVLRDIESNQELIRHIDKFNNIHVKRGAHIKDTKRYVDRLIAWIHDLYKSEMRSLKTDRGKQNKQKRIEELYTFFSSKNRNQLRKVFDLQQLLRSVKHILISKMDEIGTHKTFVKTRNGYKVVGHEGYVAIDQISGNALKLVNRLEFSYNNFSPEVIKGWDK